MSKVERPIAVTVSIVLVAVVTGALTAVGLRYYFANRDRVRAELEMTAAANADRAAIGLALPIWNIDRPQIDKVIESTMREEEILAVVVRAANRTQAFVRDASWKPIPSAGSLDLAGPGLLRQDRTVRFAGEPIGAVSVYVTPRFAEEGMRRWVISTSFAILLADVTLVVAITLLLWRIVLRPLRTVQRYAEAVSSGVRPDGPLQDARFRGEVESLRASIERMVSQLDGRYQELSISLARGHEAERAIRALAARLQAIREEEKTRISRDLHDELGQLLTGLKMDLRWVERRLGELAPSPPVNAILDHVVGASSLVDQTVAGVQRIAADLRPSALDRLGLGAALRHEARRFQERSGIPCQVELAEGLPDLRGDAATALYRISQEALTNVARHAQASRVIVALGADRDALTLRVQDDGRGIDDAPVGPNALGLLGMRERAMMLGGDVAFTRAGEGGTIVTLRVPMARVAGAGPGAGT